MDENGTMVEKGPGYTMGDAGEISESYCVKIIGTTSKPKDYNKIKSKYLTLLRSLKSDSLMLFIGFRF